MKRISLDIEKKFTLITFVIIFSFFLFLPLITDNFYYLSVATTAFIYIIFATSWDVFAGYAHLMNFGHALFVGIAGYITAYLDMAYHLPPVFVVLMCFLSCGLLGIFIGFVTLRHRGPYFAMMTIAFGAVAHESTIMFSDYTGGEEGISGISSLTSSWTGDYYAILLTMLVVFLVLLLYTRSRYGLLLKAIHQNEDAVAASGINVSLTKIYSYSLSGAICGVGGSLFAYSFMHVGPTSFEQVLSTTIIIMAMVGGMGTIIGPFFGATLLTLLNEALRELSDYRLLIYTILVVFIIYFAPKGLINIFSRVLKKVNLFREYH
ncbi:MAG: branched-chain amino acid ABC transporter permease [Desulfovermiculus sp.]|nr:branched-chain amino acid ABC transporter permease [Desulfovermiculus sp.]